MKNSTERSCSGLIRFLKDNPKLRFVMRVSVLYLSIFFGTAQLFIAQAGNSQGLEDIKVVLETRNEKLKNIFKKLERETGLAFLLPLDEVESYNNINLSKESRSVREVLDIVLAGTTMAYRQVDNKNVLIYVYANVNQETSLLESSALINDEQAEVKPQLMISGKVTDTNQVPLPGVNILIVGSTTGVITDKDGLYKIEVPDDKAVLSFSFIGYKTKEVQVSSQSVIDVVLEEDIQNLSEVVVTALGIEKDVKALGYSTTQLDGEEFTQARTVNLGNALSGKVAGVNVSGTASGPAGSTRVVIRGNTSITGNNQPLYIVDGIPIDNSTLGSAGRFGGKDWGDGLSSINPDDIESLTVLKGGNAAALYGSRASNGVIIITTKKGKATKGIGVELNSNFMVDEVIDNYQFQQQYGHGTQNRKPATPEEGLQYGKDSWGGKLDGSQVYQFDGVQRPYSYTGSKIKQFYNPGYTFSNTLSMTGGDETKNFRISGSDMNNESIIPNSGLNRKTLMLNANGKFKEKLTLSANVQYSVEKVDNRPNLSDSPNNLNYSVAILPGSIDVNDLRGTTDKIGANASGNELQLSNNSFIQNPYWTAYQNQTKDQRDRLIASGKLRYNFTDWLYIDGQIGTDWYTSRRRDLVAYGTTSQFRGSLSETEIRQRETNAQFILGMNKKYGAFDVSAMVGGNTMRRSYESLGAQGRDFIVPYFHSLTNLSIVAPNFSQSETGINSFFGSAEVSYNDFLYLTMTGRNDWFSTLDPGNNSVFYPSAGLSMVFSEALEMPSWIEFGKVRASWAQVGGGGNTPYRTNLTYGLSGQGHLNASLASIAQSQVPNTNLQPLLLTEFEVGVDMRFLKNRIGLDVALYSRKTEDDILDALISNATGFTGATLNVGEMTNKGIEILLTGTPVEGPVRWDVSLNFAKNINEVVKLTEGINELTTEQARSGRAWIQHRVGEAYSSIAGFKQLQIDGQKVYDEFGFPVRDNNVVLLGKGVAPITGGISNDFTYKNFNFGFLIDYKFGGSVYSGTNAIMYSTGVHENSVNGRDGGLALLGVDESGEQKTFNVDPLLMEDWYWMYGTYISENVVYSSDYLKLRQLIFGYNVPVQMLKKTPFKGINISFAARNLWLLYSKIDNVDPESAFNNSNSQGLELAGVPTSRSYGFNLRLKL